MPYDSNADLPQGVRDAYSGRCQTVYRKTFNGVEGDESTRAKFAHTAAKACEEAVDKMEDGEFSVTVAIAKAEASRHIAYGVVLEPRTADNPDSQGDWYTAEDVELAAYDFLLAVASGNAWGDLMHDEVSKVGWPVESYIAPVAFDLGGQAVPAGAWVMAMHFPDDEIWERIVKGELAAFSVGGRGTRRISAENP
jgi:cation transport regulator ChaB